MYKVLIKKSVEKSFQDFPKEVKSRLARALDQLAELGPGALQVKKLQTPLSGYRKRVGDYRILFDFDEDIIVVHLISKRSDVYR